MVAPGESIVSTRASGINLVGTSGLCAGLVSPDNDLQTVPAAYLPRYTCSSGTSFAAPQVAGTIALMQQANPKLTPDQIKQILQQTATPMLAYSRYEVGAGSLNTYAAVRKAVLGGREGKFRDDLSNPGVSYSRDAVAGFTGSVSPETTCSRTFSIPPDVLFATVQIGWVQNSSAASVLSTTITGPGKTIQMLAPSAMGLPSLKKTGATITDPAPGSWTISVTNVAAAAQQLVIAVEVFRARYSISGLDSLSAADRAAATRALRTGLMADRAGSFAAGSPATRIETARALMLGAGARVPQYWPDSPSFADEPADGSAIFIESVTRSPLGDLMGTVGPNFNPQSQADRMTLAVGIVKALGLEQTAQAASANNPGLTDWNLIPASARGYVSVAVSRGLMRAANGYFRASDAITRMELASAAVALQRATR
jgi:serine protease AprX